MKNKKVRIFIYSLVAWFVGMAVIVYDFAVSYAASFNENVENAEWHYFTKADGQVSDAVIDTSNYVSCNLPSDSKVSKYKYTEKLTFAFTSWNDKNYLSDFVIGSDSEIIYCYENILSESANEVLNLGAGSNVGYGSYFIVLSKTKFSVRRTDAQNLSEPSQSVSCSDANDSEIWNRDSFYMYCFSHDRYSPNMAFKSYKAKVFLDASDALNYLNTGDTSGLAWQGAAPQYDGDNIYLNDFQMIVHDSNAYSAYYLEFKYTIPEQLRDAASLKLDIAETFEWTITGLSSLVAYPRNSSGTNYIDLLQNPTGFKLYLDDIDVISKFVTDIPIASTVSRRAVLGSEIAFDTSGISIGGLGGETVVKITNSKMYLTCYVVANNKYGVSYNGSLDFVSGYNDMSSYTPDSSGNYKYNDDIKKQGHYYTDVSTDAAGNVTYNYYYYGDDNSKTEISAKDSADNTLTVVPGQTGSIINNITMPDHIFVSVSGGSGSGGSSSGSGVGDVTIEDDDLSFDSLRESIKDGYGLIDDTDTGEKGDGLVAMMSDLFGYLPASFTGLIMLGMSSVVGIAILRMIFKR